MKDTENISSSDIHSGQSLKTPHLQQDHISIVPKAILQHGFRTINSPFTTAEVRIGRISSLGGLSFCQYSFREVVEVSLLRLLVGLNVGLLFSSFEEDWNAEEEDERRKSFRRRDSIMVVHPVVVRITQVRFLLVASFLFFFLFQIEVEEKRRSLDKCQLTTQIRSKKVVGQLIIASTNASRRNWC